MENDVAFATFEIVSNFFMETLVLALPIALIPRISGDESEQEKGSPDEGGMIDDFRLWGSRRCRQTNAPPKKNRWRVEVARGFSNHNAFLSEGGALAVLVNDFLRTPHWTRDKKEFSPPVGQGEARLRLAFLPLARRTAREVCWW